MRSNRYYKRLDLLRLVSCIAVLFYHIGLLKGGYLAVCTFFVLSGYLSAILSLKKENFSLKKYYISRLKKIYLPLILVVFISISIFSIFKIELINLKPEVTSILFGYNNYWQLSANLDYFVRNISSPFTHLWYISILIQFEFFFPFIFLILRKIGKRISKIIPSLILLFLALISYFLFFKSVNNNNIMVAYYDTFNRLFSLLFGVFLGFIHHYYYPITIRTKKFNKIIFSTYLLILIFMFFKISSESNYFSLGMILSTIISMRLIDYAISNISIENIFDKIVNSLSNITYEVYLFQYPIIFLFQKVSLNSYIKIPIIVIVTFIISYILHKCINIKTYRYKNIKIILLILVTFISVCGLYKYIVAKDYTKQMKTLEKHINENQEFIKKKQEEYSEKKKEELDKWEEVLNDLNASETKIKEVVKNLNIVGIGDSVMAGTADDLYEMFPNGYFDGKVNRTEYQAIEVIDDLKNKGILSDVVLFNIGTNGQCNEACKDKLMQAVGDRKVFWVNATNADYDTFNSGLEAIAKKYNNIHIIDWVSVANKNPDYLYKDRVHPTPIGSKAYVEVVYNAICEEYLKEFNLKKEKLLKEHDENEKRKITFIGNNLLLESYKDILKYYPDSEYIIDKFNTESLISMIKDRISANNISYNIVLVLDKKVNLNDKEYQQLIELCIKQKLYVVNITNNNIDNPNINVINFYNKKNKKYIKSDNTLTSEGNKLLAQTIKKYLK